MALKVLILLILNLLLISSQVCPSNQQGPSIQETKSFLSELDQLLSLNKEIVDLQSKCLKEGNIFSITAVEFQEGKFRFETVPQEPMEKFFESLVEAERDSCFKIRELEDQFPEENYFDLSHIIKRFKEKNPVLFKDLVKSFKETLTQVKGYFKKCSNKGDILNQKLFQKFGPGFDVQQVTFLPRTDSFADLSFKHQFTQGDPKYRDSIKQFSDQLNHLERHFRACLIQNVDPSDSLQEVFQTAQNRSEDPSEVLGFQILQKKLKNEFSVLSSLKLRLNLQGNLKLYFFDNNKKLKEVETIKNIDTKGSWAVAFIRDLDTSLEDKGYLLIDYEGYGALGKKEADCEQDECISGSQTLVLLNKSLLKEQIVNAQKGKEFKIQNSRLALDSELTFVSKDHKGRKNPRVEIKDTE